MNQNRKAPTPGTRAERAFVLDRAAVNEESRTVEIAFSSEAPYERSWGVEILDHDHKSVNLKRLLEGAPLLVNHDPNDQVGVIESARIDADRVGRATVRFGKSARAEEIYQDVLDGIRGKSSVGYSIDELVQEKKAGDAETYRVTRWTPYEVSLVPVPADFSVGVGRADDPIPPKEQNMPEVNTPATVDTAAIERAAAENATKAELRRVNEILAVGEEHGQMELARAAIKDGTPAAEFNVKLLAAVRAKAAEPVQFGQGARAKDNLADDPKLGFTNYGEFCRDVARASSGKGQSEKLSRAATVFGNEASGPDGGFAVPQEFATQIASVPFAEESLLSRCDNTPVTGNSMRFPKDETTPWGSTGITAAWEGEGDQTTPKKPALKHSELYLRKLKVLVAASEELLADAPAMSSHILRKSGEAVDWKVNDAIINGTGAGMPLGVMVAASTVSQAKETSQTAATINGANIAKMYGRVLKGPGANLAWIVHPDAINQVLTLTIGDQPIWTPPQEGFKSAPMGFLLGRPIIESDALQTLGTVGDIILGNFSGYRAITKAGGVEFAQSMHLWFDQDLMAFRLTFRMDGQPALAAAVSPKNGSSTRSHFVTLATRG